MKASEQTEQVEQTFKLFASASDGVTELRSLKVGKYRQTASGYFEASASGAFVDGVRAIAKMEPAGIYATLNVVNPALLARAVNRVQCPADTTTADADITRRLWILADLDANRQAGISASDAQHDDALIRTTGVRSWLRDTHGANTIFADSGNGGHALIPVNLPNDADALRLVSGVLAGLAAKFNDDNVHVDTSVGNAGRISKVYGTQARKGDSTADRPHRYARLLNVPSDLVPLSLETLEAIAALATPAQAAAPRPTAKASTGYTGKSLDRFDVPAFLAKHGIAVRNETEGKPGWHHWNLEACPFNPDHTYNDAIITQNSSGALTFKCLHDSCKGNKWQTLRAKLEPGWTPYDPNRPVPAAGRSRAAHKASTEPQSEQGEDGTEEVNAQDTQDSRPLIETNHAEIPDMTAEALDALIAANDPPRLFVRGGKLVRVGVDEDSTPSLQTMTHDMLRGVLARVARFVSTSEKRGETPVVPPQHVVADILSLPEYDLPPIAGIVTAPVFASDGTLCAAPGYHKISRFYHHAAADFELPDTTPCPANVSAALTLLRDDLLGDFPFVDAASEANALALLLLPFARYLVSGPTPLHLLNSPERGTGKGLLADACSLPFVPQGLSVMTAPAHPDDWKKELLASLLPAPSHILIDNSRSLDSPHLDAVLTAPERWTGRVLGLSENATVRVKNVWLATGNNLVIKGDLYRRSVLINMDSGLEKPYERTGFRHPNLRVWIKENRPALVGACVTIIRAWLEAGSPPYAGPRKKGSFESWLSVIGGILENVGITELLANSEAGEAEVDPEVQAWKAFLHDWYTGRKAEKAADDKIMLACTAAEILPYAENHLMESLGEKEGKARTVRMGRLLNSNKGRVYGDYRIKHTLDRTKTGLYTVEKIEKPQSAGDAGDAGDNSAKRGSVSENAQAHKGTQKNTTGASADETPASPASPANGHSAELVAMLEAARENRAIPAGVKITLPGADVANPTTEDFNLRVRQYASGYSQAIKNKDSASEAKYQALLNCCLKAWRQYQVDADTSDTSDSPPRWE